MKKSIGIDLGTTNSVIAFKDVDIKVLRNKENEELTRSCVALINDEIYVGKTAYNIGLKQDPSNTILSVKRIMGGAIKEEMVQELISKKYYKYGITEFKGGTRDSVAVILGGKQYTPEQISAEILKKLKRDAEDKLSDEVTHAVITVPAYFTEKQKNATRVAAQMAGLKVQKLLAEPTAAAIAYGYDNLKPGEARTILIYDFGGGTFDLSILNIVDGQYIEAGTSGDRWLGGDDLDRALRDLIYNKVQIQLHIEDLTELIHKLPGQKRNRYESTILNEVEQAKIQLSSVKSAAIFIPSILEDENGDIIDIDVTITREEFENCVRPQVQRTIELIDQLIKEIGYDMGIIDSILLVGGSSCIPLVKEMLSSKYGSNKIKITEKPMLAVAEGAAILAHRLGDTYDPVLDTHTPINDISYSTNHNYYIELIDRDGEHIKEKLIEKQTPLPLTSMKIFKTTVDNQKIAEVVLHTDIENGKYLELTKGFFTIDEDLPARSELIFNIELDINEIFNIKVYSKDHKAGEKQILLGRGLKDSKALDFLTKKLTEIGTESYTVAQQEFFYKEIKKEIERANTIGIENPDSEIWSEIGTNVYTAFEKAENLKNSFDEDEMTIFIATILINEYPMLIYQPDMEQLKTLLDKTNSSSDAFEKSQAVSGLKIINDKYPVLVTVFTLKIAAKNAESTNIVDSNKLLHMHDKIVSLFKIGRKEEAFALLDEALEITEQYFRGFTAGTAITNN